MHMAELTRRAVVAAAALAAVPTAKAAQPLFTEDEALTMRAETMIIQYIACGIYLCPQPNGTVGKFIYLDDLANDFEEREAALDQKLRDNPALGKRMKELLFEQYRM